MDKRRRLLGLKKRNETVNKEVQVAKAKSSSTRDKNVGAVKDEETIKEEFQSIQAQSVTPEKANATPKRRRSVTSIKEDSPIPSFYGPGIQSMFPRNFGSPEIEVSWDWGCSQIPKDMLPLRRSKRKSQSQPPPVISPVPTPCPRIPLGRHMSEEENQERLAFYKNILSNSFKVVQEEVDSKNNNVEKDIVPYSTNIITTPKQSAKSRLEPGKKEELNTYFDDSANEFMLECSQAIEEQLKNGVIDMGPIVNIKVPNKKHAYSPVVEPEHVVKRVCHGRSKLNLFPEVSNHDDTSKQNNLYEKENNFSLKSPTCTQSKTNPGSNKPQSNFSKAVCENGDDDDDDDIFTKPTQPNEVLTLKNLSCVSETNADDNWLSGGNSGKTKQTINGQIKLQVKGNGEIGHQSITVCNTLKQSTHGVLDRRPVHQNQHMSVNKNIVNNGNNNVNAQKISNEGTKTNNVNNHSLNMSKRFQHIKPDNKNQVVSKLQSGCNLTNNINTPSCNQSLKQLSSVGHKKDLKGPQTSVNNIMQDEPFGKTDITSLLDDGLDMELCSLNLESLCSNSNPKEPTLQPKTKTVPEICSQQQIEAKRLAALNRLMMKKRK